MLRILVCFKQVTYLPSRMAMDARGRLDPDGMVYIPNPYDEVALEEALRIKEGTTQAEVVLISMGPARVEDALRYGMAMGADWGIHIFDEKLENVNHSIISKALVKVIENQGFDIILCGEKAIDTNGSTLGGFVAELLGVSYVSSVTEITIHEARKLRMFRILERGDRQVVECEMPTILSVGRGTVKPRYPTLKGRHIASTKQIVRVPVTELGIPCLSKVEPQVKISKISSLRPKPKKMFTPNSNVSAAERIKMVMSGGVAEKKSSLLKGSPQELSGQFINFLEENLLI